MGRELRRVPLDFDWPLNQRWTGFVNLHRKPCPEDGKTCFRGLTAAGRWLESVLRLMGVISEEGQYDEIPKDQRNPERLFPHPYLVEFPQAPTLDTPPEIQGQGARAVYRWWESLAPGERIVLPTMEFTRFFRALCEEKEPPRCNFNMNTWRAQERLLELAGMPKTWGICQVCDGDAMDPAVKEAYEAWEKTPPPTGEGWQLWETVSEGSPISPVFKTADELVDWMVQHSHFSREAAEHFVHGPGWAPSGVDLGKGFVNGVEGLYQKAQQAKK